MEEKFLEIYETLDSESVPYGDAEDREGVRGSPVVPRSAKFVVLFITLLDNRDSRDLCLVFAQASHH